MGETIRRLIGKVALQLPQTVEAVRHLQPTQQVVGAKRAVEHTAILVQEALHVIHSNSAATPWCVLKVDQANAFNSVSR